MKEIFEKYKFNKNITIGEDAEYLKRIVSDEIKITLIKK